MLFLDMGEGNAPTSYRRNVNNEIFFITTNLVSTDNAHVPLVSAVFVSPEVTTTVAIQPTPTTRRMSATAQTPSGTPRPPTELLPVTAIAVGASVGGVVLAAVVTVLIIVAAVACARKNQNPTHRSAEVIDMTATAEDTYDYPFHEPTAVATKRRNEAYASTAITTEQNEAYASTAITTEHNEAYATTAITMEQNKAYVTTAITTEQNEAYVTAITACTVAPNEAYGTTGDGDTATDVYDYIQ